MVSTRTCDLYFVSPRGARALLAPRAHATPLLGRPVAPRVKTPFRGGFLSKGLKTASRHPRRPQQEMLSLLYASPGALLTPSAPQLLSPSFSAYRSEAPCMQVGGAFASPRLEFTCTSCCRHRSRQHFLALASRLL